MDWCLPETGLCLTELTIDWLSDITHAGLTSEEKRGIMRYNPLRPSHDYNASASQRPRASEELAPKIIRDEITWSLYARVD